MRTPCYDCTLKHLTKAKTYSDSYKSDPSNILNFLQAVGNLGQAEDEIAGYDPVTAMTIRDFRLEYMADKQTGGWDSLLESYYKLWTSSSKHKDGVNDRRKIKKYDGRRYRTNEDQWFIRACEALVLSAETALGYPEYGNDILGILEHLLEEGPQEPVIDQLINTVIKEQLADPMYVQTAECWEVLRELAEELMMLRY